MISKVVNNIRLFRKTLPPLVPNTVQKARSSTTDFLLPRENKCEYALYDALREAVPIIDAAITKTVRLAGGFTVRCSDESFQEELDNFVYGVKVGTSGRTLHSFIDSYLDSLLTYGSAIGEIVLSKDGTAVAGLCNGSIKNIEVREGKSPLEAEFFVGKEKRPVKNPELILFSALNPPPESPYGRSVLRGLPYLSKILMRIYESIGQNFDRVGNVRYAVTYKPQNDGDMVFAKERAEQIAEEWSRGMEASRCGQVRDFIAVGDVEIKAIGADNQIIGTEIPVRQLLEQITAKLAIPPFLLGLSWSSTERMSAQQADILTSELEFYRRLLTPTIRRICETYLGISGIHTAVEVLWNNINLQDETELAEARLKNAQAAEIELRLAEKN